MLDTVCVECTDHVVSWSVRDCKTGDSGISNRILTCQASGVPYLDKKIQRSFIVAPFFL